MKLSNLHRSTVIIFLVSGIISLLAIFKLSDYQSLQLTILTVVVLFYLIWGIFYHHVDKSLKVEIVLEYILTAALVLSFIYGILI